MHGGFEHDYSGAICGRSCVYVGNNGAFFHHGAPAVQRESAYFSVDVQGLVRHCGARYAVCVVKHVHGAFGGVHGYAVRFIAANIERLFARESYFHVGAFPCGSAAGKHYLIPVLYGRENAVHLIVTFRKVDAARFAVGYGCVALDGFNGKTQSALLALGGIARVCGEFHRNVKRFFFRVCALALPSGIAARIVVVLAVFLRLYAHQKLSVKHLIAGGEGKAYALFVVHVGVVCYLDLKLRFVAGRQAAQIKRAVFVHFRRAAVCKGGLRSRVFRIHHFAVFIDGSGGI